MKWNGIVSQPGKKTMATRFAAAKAAHATSTGLRHAKAITDMAHGLDRCVPAELVPQPADAHVDDVRARIEVIAPDLREQALATQHLAGVLGEVMQQSELPVGELHHRVPDARLPPREVEHERAGADHVAV